MAEKTLKKIRKNRNGKSVFMTLLLSFLFVFMIPVLIGSIVYVRIEQIMIENAYRSNSAMLEQVKHVANGQTQEIEYLMRQIAFNPKQQLLMQKGGSFTTPREQYQYIEFMDELTRYTAYNFLVEDVYVYFGNTDTILTPTMKTNASTFYHQIYTYRDMPFETFKRDLLLGQHFKSYLHTELNIGSMKGQSKISFVQSLPYGDMNDVSGNLVILINESQFQGLLKEVEGLHKGTLYILNRDKEVLIGPEGNKRLDAYRSRLIGEHGEFLDDADGEENYVSYVTSSENGWTFLSVFPKKVVLEQVHTVKSWSIAMVLVCLIVGILICVYLTRRHYSPIKNLVGMIMHGRSDIERGKRNELQLIGDTMQTLFGKHDELQQRLASQLPLMRASFFTRLIHGQADLKSMTTSDMDMLDVNFDHPCFAVAVLDIEDGSPFMKEDTEREWILLRFIVLNVSGELLGRNGYAFETAKNRVVVLINLTDGTEDSEGEMQSFLVAFAGILKERFKTSMTVGVSSKHKGLESVAQGYEEAMIALSYKLLEGSEAILHYNTERTMDRGTYRFPTELEVQLTNYMKNGDWGNTERLLDSLYAMNFEQGQLSPGMGRWFFLDLHSTLLKIAEAVHVDAESMFPGETDPAKWMIEATTAEQMFERIKVIYRQICGVVQQGRTDHQGLVYRKIVTFVEERYADNNLGLTMIADKMNLSPIYVSAFFKKHSGENLTDFITRTRLGHAKRLLAEPLTVQEIALQVGYASNIVLTKVFKKIEGVTPGKYREQLRNLKKE